MALTLGDRTLYRLSVDDVERMLGSGVLTEDTPVEFWVVDVARRRLEVRRDPVGAEYRRTEVHGQGEAVTALDLDLPALELDLLF